MTANLLQRNLCSILVLLAFLGVVGASLWSSSRDNEEVRGAGADEPVEYGVDISFPMHYGQVSTNYPWLEHNRDPSKPVPKEYENMPIQPLGDRQAFYNNYLQGCKDKFGSRGAARCEQNEIDRISMSLRQPQSMQNYVSFPHAATIGIDLFF